VYPAEVNSTQVPIEEKPHFAAERRGIVAVELLYNGKSPRESGPDDGPGFFGAMRTSGSDVDGSDMDRSGVDRGRQNPRCA
jgi:hypothetical protein